MKVVISWSGERSKRVAAVFREWLPSVIQAIDPWMSDRDLDKGSRWTQELATQLAEAKVGIICVTPENQEAPWLMFESGALSKTLDPETRVCAFLHEMGPSDLGGSNPLTQFQATVGTEEEVRKLMATLNDALGDERLEEGRLEKSFGQWWPELSSKLSEIPPPKNDDSKPPPRDGRQVLDDILETVRDNRRLLQRSSTRDKFSRLMSGGLGFGGFPLVSGVTLGSMDDESLKDYFRQFRNYTAHGGPLMEIPESSQEAETLRHLLQEMVKRGHIKMGEESFPLSRSFTVVKPGSTESSDEEEPQE